MYLDNAATSFPKPDVVCDAVDHWMRQGAAAAGRGSHRGTDDAARVIEQCRMGLARLLGASSASQMVFTSNCTDSLNTVLQGFVRPGDRVIASTLDHNSVLRPLKAMEATRGMVLDLVDFDPATGLLRTDELERLLTGPPVRLVVLNHASNVTGVVQPIADLSRSAHNAGAAVLVDAAQTAGHLPLNVRELDIDFLAAAGHKGLHGPLGTGLLWIRPGLEHELTPLRYGGTGTSSESLEQPGEMPARFESGNLNLPGIAGLNAAIEWIVARGVAEIGRQTDAVVRQLIGGLSGIRGVTLHTPAAGSDLCGPISFNVDGMDCRDVALILDQSFDIRCRSGLHCAPLAHQSLGTFTRGGTVRFSPGVFTTEAEISTAIAAVSEIIRAV
jgi:cysteine desulfurase / selenocysteine lyase